MATHVSNIVKRGYVTLDDSRRLVPQARRARAQAQPSPRASSARHLHASSPPAAPASPQALGLALVHAYVQVDEGLALPCVRASIEAACARVARAEARTSCPAPPPPPRLASPLPS